MESREIRNRFLRFFEARGHAIIPSASLVPENDPSVLFTTAGMQPLAPYLLGATHPQGRRLVNVQKCVRTQDIDQVGDATHDTFFEMLGNWSLGDSLAKDGIGDGYFKKEAIEWSYEFLTSKEEGLGLDPKRLYITVFAGDRDVSRDEESAEIWVACGIPEKRIYYLGAEKNWWSPGPNGPCGPDTEMYYDVTEEGLGDLSHGEFLEADKDQKIVEIWNDVFMEYEKKEGNVIGKLKQKNVDTGAGLERMAMVMQGRDNIFETDLFASIMKKLDNWRSPTSSIIALQTMKVKRIIADHVRTAVFLIADGVSPANVDRGYVLRRLIRRAVRFAEGLAGLTGIAEAVIEKYGSVYGSLETDKKRILEEITREEIKFRETLSRGMKEFEKLATGDISGRGAFLLFSSYGFPLEMTCELAAERGIRVDEEEYRNEFSHHQEISRTGSEQKFKGGLADASEMSIKYHTATHMLHKALRDVLGPHVFQKGSNITTERLRFDFSHNTKMTLGEINKVEDSINQKINEALPVSWEKMDYEEAKRKNVLGLFENKYEQLVKVYTIGHKGYPFSVEICGGPHVNNTSELGDEGKRFKILKEEAVAQGIRRIKAALR